MLVILKKKRCENNKIVNEFRNANYNNITIINFAEKSHHCTMNVNAMRVYFLLHLFLKRFFF
jgi:hypothetical protein